MLKTIELNSSIDALGVIDVQRAFMPGGSLPTPKGRSVVGPINRLLHLPFGFRFATQDWHPQEHVSFASNHPGRKAMDLLRTDHGELTLWPDHALQGSREAELYRKLDGNAFDLVIRKGARADAEGLSAFSDHGGEIPSGLGALLRERGVKRVFLAGLALDICVAATAQDSVREGFTTFVFEDASRSSKPKELSRTLADLERAGVTILKQHDLDVADAS